MKFSILSYESPDNFAARSDARREAHFGAVFRYIAELKSAGVFAGGAGLELPHTATTLRLRNGERLVQDGPYADTKEQLGGLFIIDVPDEATAVAWAKRCPHEPGRVVELRAHIQSPG
ncbi:MAG TPA: YciI family protein [Rudaea sp.]|nr:YciI family protein [Rudaea sp.]